MPHNFSSRMPDAPESLIARKKIADFIHLHGPDRQRGRAPVQIMEVASVSS